MSFEEVMSGDASDIDTNSEVTMEQLAERLDILGNQMNWLCDNLQNLFVFVQQVGSNGGGIRGLMSALKSAPPQLDTE